MFEKEREQYLTSNGFETTRLKAVLFDMDGVLFDSMPNHAYAWSHAMTQFGLKMSPEEAYMHDGNGTINLLTQKYWGRDATEEELDEIYQAKADVFNMREEAPEMPGAKDMLYAVKEAGCQPVLVTGSGQLSLIDRLNKHFPGIFTKDKMVTSFERPAGCRSRCGCQDIYHCRKYRSPARPGTSGCRCQPSVSFHAGIERQLGRNSPHLYLKQKNQARILA